MYYMVTEKLTPYSYEGNTYLCITPIIIRSVFTGHVCKSYNYIRQRTISAQLFSNKLTKAAFNDLTGILHETTKVLEVSFIPHSTTLNFCLDLSIHQTINKRSERDVSLGSFIFDNKKYAIELCHIILYRNYEVYSQTIMDCIFK